MFLNRVSLVFLGVVLLTVATVAGVSGAYALARHDDDWLHSDKEINIPVLGQESEPGSPQWLERRFRELEEKLEAIQREVKGR